MLPHGTNSAACHLIWFMWNKVVPCGLKYLYKWSLKPLIRSGPWPRGDSSPEESGTIAYKRDFDVRSAGAGGVLNGKVRKARIGPLCSRKTRCLPHLAEPFIHVKPVGDLDEVSAVPRWRATKSQQWPAAPKNDAETIVKQLAHWGVTEFVPSDKCGI